MGVNKVPQYPLRIRPDVLDKMRYIAYENSRSTNKEIEQACIKYVKAYENENGEITEDDIDRMLDSLC